MPTEFEKKIQESIENKIPAEFYDATTLLWSSFTDANESILKDFQCDQDVLQSLARVWTCSEVAARWCIRYPQWLVNLSQINLSSKAYSRDDFSVEWKKESENIENDEDLLKKLREYRNQQMLRIIWRDICNWSTLENTCLELSRLAVSCIEIARNYYSHPNSNFTEEFGQPFNDDNNEQELLVVAMGKLGAGELNLSSDIDLIFSYPMDGKTKGGKNNIDNADYFTRLGKKIIAALNNTTEDGFVFRVDMRLRPFGDGGALASSFNALENYYQIHGREWERYAMIKARVVVGDNNLKNELMTTLKPFVYRRYLDYGAYESMRDLKGMISKQVQKKGMESNVKLGAGGIREIEFIGQVFQLIRGGRDARYQQRPILTILDLIKEDDRLPEYVVNDLKKAYVFLRNTEHRIQAVNDRQTHQLPTTDIEQTRLAYSMNFENWDEFKSVLDKHRDKVQSYFEQVFDAPQTEEDSDENHFNQIWLAQFTGEDVADELKKIGYENTELVLKTLADLKASKSFQTRTTEGQKRLNKLMPMLIGAVGQVENSDLTLQRVIEIVEQIARRSVYMVLLIENPLALSQLIKLCEQSSWVSHYISKHPLLLDDLLDPRSLYLPATKESLLEECTKKLVELKNNDEEQVADTVRHFKQSNVLRIAAADLASAVSLMQISDHLSWLAEVVLTVTLEQAWETLVKRYGSPITAEKKNQYEKGFAIIAYGKLGGGELSYSSDLDMVFLHVDQSDDMMTVIDEAIEAVNKPSSIVCKVFYMRLGQRLIHLLTTRTAAGRLYEADLRLRPNGESGMLVSSVSAYSRYQNTKAWVWEHQALVRARAVCGDGAIIKEFESIRKNVLTIKRDKNTLKDEVIKMREKMRQSLSKDTEQQFDIKQGVGGLVDIEFIVQYCVLAWANESPELCDYTDNIRLLMQLEKVGKLPSSDSEILIKNYKKYRQRVHRLALQEQKGIVSVDKYKQQREEVGLVWRKIFTE